MENRYLYFEKNGNDNFYCKDLDELIKYYHKILDVVILEKYQEQSDQDFYKNIIDDGYFIIQFLGDDTNIHFYIDMDRLNNMYEEINGEEEIIETLKLRLK